jgi:phage tail tape-measure protein
VGKAGSLGEVGSCRNYEKVEEAEEESRHEEDKALGETAIEGVPAITGCTAGADAGGLIGSMVPGVGTGVGAAAGCLTGGLVNSRLGVNPSEPEAGPRDMSSHRMWIAASNSLTFASAAKVVVCDGRRRLG